MSTIMPLNSLFLMHARGKKPKKPIPANVHQSFPNLLYGTKMNSWIINEIYL